MPVPKRYFHCSQELNFDSEVWEFTTLFGDRSIRTWIQVLAYLDRSQNRWKLSGDWLGTLSRTVRQSSANCSRQVRHMVEKGWLLVAEQAADGSPLVLEGRNWLKYNRRQERKRDLLASDKVLDREPLLTFPTPTPTPKDKEGEVGPADPLTDLGKLKSSLSKNTKIKFSTRRQALEEFTVTDAVRDWARNEFSVEIPDDIISEFKNHWRGEPDKKLKIDWEATFKVNIRKLVGWGTLKPKPILKSASYEGAYHKKVVL